MRSLALGLLLSLLLLALLAVQSVDVPSVSAAPSIYQADLFLNGNNVTTIEGRFDINGSIFVEGNATLVLNNAVVNITQKSHYEHNIVVRNPINGNPRLQSYNTTITTTPGYYCTLSTQNGLATITNTTTSDLSMNSMDSAKTSITNSTIGKLTVHHLNTVVSISNSTIKGEMETAFSPTLSISNSTVASPSLSSIDVNCSLSKVGPGFFAYWNYLSNSSVATVPTSEAANLTLTRTTVLGDWEFEFSGSSNATITDSSLIRVVCSTKSYASLVNTTISWENSAGGEGKIYTAWYLDAHVIDSTGQNVPLANVTAAYLNSTTAQRKQANATGWARLILTEKVMNATGQYPIGNYTVRAEYGNHSNTVPMNITGNKSATIPLTTLVIPEFQAFHALLLTAALTLASVLFLRIKRFSEKK